MNRELCLVICFIVGVLAFYLLKQSCGCKTVEGVCFSGICWGPWEEKCGTIVPCSDPAIAQADRDAKKRAREKKEREERKKQDEDDEMLKAVGACNTVAHIIKNGGTGKTAMRPVIQWCKKCCDGGNTTCCKTLKAANNAR